MNDSRQHDAGASLADCVRQFRRLARLASADPLRLLPLDPLTQLAALSAPVTTLIDISPFERLRQTMTAPPAAARRTAPRTRLQPFAAIGSGARTTSAAVGGALAPEVATGHAAPTAARQAPSSSAPSHAPSAQEPLRREAASTASLAERRAALRRGNVDAGSPSRSTSRPVAQGEATTGVRTTPANEARAINVPVSREHIDEGISDPARQLTRVSFEPVLFDRDRMESAPDEPFAPAAMDRATHHASLIDEQQSASRPIDRPGAPGALVPFEIPAGSDVPAAAARSGSSDPGPSAVAHAPASRLAELVPPGARATPQAEAGAARRPRASEPTSEFELADAVFEALYRDGVDVSWP